MSNMLLNNATQLILGEFCSDYNKRIYGWQLSKKFKLNQKTISNNLNNLEKQNIVKYTTEGKNKYYYLNNSNPQIEDILKIVEIERKNMFLEKYRKIMGLIKELEKRSSGLLVVFGSYASFSSNDKSDLDLFSLGKISEVEDLEKIYHIKINIVKSTKDKFNKSDIFIKEIIKNHIILKGVEEFLELTWQSA